MLSKFIKQHTELCTDTVFLVGNGSSRESIHLEKLRPYGTIFGCNALYIDFTPDILAAIDNNMILDIVKSKYPENNIFLVPNGRKTGSYPVLTFKSATLKTTGGFLMKVIGKEFKPKICYMLGMDGYPGNIYTNKHPIYHGKQVTKWTGVMKDYKNSLTSCRDTLYINVNIKDSWTIPSRSSGFTVGDQPNYSFLELDEFKKQFNV